MKKIEQEFYAGTSGLVVPVAKSDYPPQFEGKTRLHYYASLFNTIEINSSFYKLPQAATVARWRDSVGNDFKFTFKLSKVVSHAKGLEFNEDDVLAFWNVVENVEDKKGCILVQFPPGLKIDTFNKVERLLEILNESNKDGAWKIGMEFRNASWYISEVFETLNYYKATMVIQDLPAAPTPLTGTTARFKYLRFHGSEPRYRGSYSDVFLKTYAGYVKEWMDEGKTVYCYFNNTMGNAGGDLRRMNEILSNIKS